MPPFLLYALLAAGGYVVYEKFIKKQQYVNPNAPPGSGAAQAAIDKAKIDAYNAQLQGLLPSGGGALPPGTPVSATMITPGQYTVTTQTSDLNLRPAPDMNASTNIGLAKGSIVILDGTVQNGFAHVIDDGLGNSGWASIDYLTAVDTSVQSAGIVCGLAQVTNTARLQRNLNKVGAMPALIETGVLDNETCNCLARLQAHCGLPVTGQPDPMTLHVLEQSTT